MITQEKLLQLIEAAEYDSRNDLEFVSNEDLVYTCKDLNFHIVEFERQDDPEHRELTKRGRKILSTYAKEYKNRGGAPNWKAFLVRKGNINFT